MSQMKLLKFPSRHCAVDRRRGWYCLAGHQSHTHFGFIWRPWAPGITRHPTITTHLGWWWFRRPTAGLCRTKSHPQHRRRRPTIGIYCEGARLLSLRQDCRAAGRRCRQARVHEAIDREPSPSSSRRDEPGTGRLCQHPERTVFFVLLGPIGPSDQFRADDLDCRQYAHSQIGARRRTRPRPTREPERRRRHRHRCCCRSRHRRSPGAAVGAGTGSSSARRRGGQADTARLRQPAPLRQRLHPVHVRQGAPGTVPAGMALPAWRPRTPSGNIPPPPPEAPPPPPPGVR